MAKKRVSIPRVTEKSIYQEAGSTCAFCSENDVRSLQIHHIDDEPSNNEPSNLLLVCANCHTKITSGLISESDVRVKKREIIWRPRPPTASISVNIVGSKFKGDIAQNITKITTPKRPKIQHPDGSIGSDLQRKGYIQYLITRYFDCRKADLSFGRTGAFSHAEVHKTIERTFGYQTYFMPAGLFPKLVEFLESRIDRTILGKRNLSNGTPNYHSFEAHQRL